MAADGPLVTSAAGPLPAASSFTATGTPAEFKPAARQISDGTLTSEWHCRAAAEEVRGEYLQALLRDRGRDDLLQR